MSAFLVDPSTINKIVSYLHGKARNERGHIGYMAKRIISKTEFDITDQSNLPDFGLALYNVNISAVSQRYPNDTRQTLPGTCDEAGHLVDFEYKPMHGYLSTIGAYKAIQCWLYQCSEGNVDQHPLYKAMNEIRLAIAEEVITNLPEYDKAIWG